MSTIRNNKPGSATINNEHISCMSISIYKWEVFTQLFFSSIVLVFSIDWFTILVTQSLSLS